MRYIVFSDLHSNFEALKQFEKEISSIPFDRLVCLGDIVGYGADPNSCIDWVRRNVDLPSLGIMISPWSIKLIIPISINMH